MCEGRPEQGVPREHELVVLQADEILPGDRTDAVPVGQRQAHRGQRWTPDQDQVEGERHAHHERNQDLVVAGQNRVAAPAACGYECPRLGRFWRPGGGYVSRGVGHGSDDMSAFTRGAASPRTLASGPGGWSCPDLDWQGTSAGSLACRSDLNSP